MCLYCMVCMYCVLGSVELGRSECCMQASGLQAKSADGFANVRFTHTS